MRLLRLRLDNFDGAHPLELRFGDPLHADRDAPRVSFIVGANGLGKSRVLAQLGLIFSHLAINERPELAFELEYQLGDQTMVLVTTDGMTARERSLGNEPPQLTGGLWLATSRGGHMSFHSSWPPSPAGWLPGKVCGYSTGPVSRLEWALTASTEVRFSARRALLAAETPPLGVPEDAWSRDRADRLSALEERRQRTLDNPVTAAVDASDSMLAALALLAHPAAGDGAISEERTRVAARIGLAADPLVLFSLDLPVEWEERVHGSSADEFSALVGRADRHVEVSVEGEAVERVVFERGPGFEQLLRTQARTPRIWFEQLHRWWRRRAIVGCHLVLARPEGGGCILGEDLSDGEYLMLGRYSLLLLLAEVDDLLVLLDEPETHFNDRWKVDLVRDVAALVACGHVGTAGLADVLISTHSDLTLTDADHGCVQVFERSADGERLRVRAPEISPLAADRSDIMLDIFGVESAIGARAHAMVDGVLQDGDIDDLRLMLDRVGPGFHRFRLQSRLAELEGGLK